MNHLRGRAAANGHVSLNRSGLPRLGLIVNPIAGIGGTVGLKGSDGAEIQRQALQLGALPQALNRTVQALERLVPARDDLEVITYPGQMGEEAARACGFEPAVIGSIVPRKTTPEDTRTAAREMHRLEVALLLFAGGDGTARDIYNAVGVGVPVLGIPAGVKIHSAVFATNPTSAGDLASLFLQGRISNLREAEVMDIDEDAYRRGVVSARLYGYLQVPFKASLVQSLKTASSPGEKSAMAGIAWQVIDGMEDDRLYILGPGTTTRAITSALGLDKTLIGVDVLFRGQLLVTDANESQLLGLLQGHKAKIVVTPIGGQGCILGRGNQQLSPKVIRNVGLDNIVVVSTPTKIQALGGQPLWVDTGDRSLDQALSGYVRVITGYNEQIIYKVSCQ